MLNEQAVQIAVKIIKLFEGCNLIAYPDPASPLYKALALHNMLKKYMDGAIRYKDLPDNFKALSGTPWTVGYGMTVGVTKDTVYTQEQANTSLEAHVRKVMQETLEDAPKLSKEVPARIAAITSLAYNIGKDAFKTSTVAKRIASGALSEVAEAIKMWNKAKGKIVDGLVKRRQTEADLWNSKG